MKEWSRHWKSSKSPRKQRKYRHNAPLHVRKKFMSVNLSKELRTKYKRRNLPARKGDTVKILRGQFKKNRGKITKVNLKKIRMYVESAEILKKDGSKTFYPISPSNLQLVELNLEDKKRKKILDIK